MALNLKTEKKKMGYPKNEQQELLYEYDFSKDGGGTASPIALRPLVNGLKEGVIIRDIEIRVKTALASGGSATVTLGNTGDPDGFMVDFFSLAGSAGAVINVGEVAGALVWDDTNDHKIHYPIDATAANQDLVLDVGTAALTAGKLEILVKISAQG